MKPRPFALNLFVAAAAALASAAMAGADAKDASNPNAGGKAAVGGGIRPDATMLQFPDVSATHIVFSYANDLWLVPRAGGTATKLASPPGQETFPRFSADGKTIAFVGNYEGNRDIYTIPSDPAAAGLAYRVTHHPAAETICDWTPDGKILFYTTGFGGLARQQQLMTVTPAGGLPEKMPVPYGAFAAVSPDGNWLAYTPHTTDFRTWKRYRGGMATDIWLFNLKDKTSKQATDWEGTDTSPMWAPGNSTKLYYLTDQGSNHRLNLWSYDIPSGKRTQLTNFADYDVKWPSIGPGADGKSGEIVFQNGASLYLLDLKSGQHKPIEVVIPGDRPTLREKWVDFGNFITSGDVSPSGKRVVVEARGDIWSLPAEKGASRAITRTSGIAERNPMYSPDGKTIAYLSDATGEYEIYLVPAEGKGETKQLTTSGNKGVPTSSYRYLQSWSPDSKLIAWNDKTGTYYITTVETGDTVKVAQDQWDNYGGVSFSSDSQWLALTLTDANTQGAIHLYNIGTKELTRVTDPMFAAANPAFDRKGDYLYFTSRRKFSPTYSDLDSSFIYKDSVVVLASPLRKDMPSPFAPKNDEEKADKDKKDGDKTDDAAKKDDDSKKDGDAKKDEKKEDKKDAGEKKDADKDADKKDEKKAPEPVKIDLDGLERRAVELPMPPGSYGNLLVGDGGKLFFMATEPPDPDADEQRAAGVIKMFDISDEGKDGKRTAKTVLAKAEGGFSISADGKKLLVMQDKDMAVIDAAPDQKFEKKVPKNEMHGEIDPRAEWNQIFLEAWRLQRDFFYVPNMHGVDWPAMKTRYQAMLADCVTRDDVNYVLKELISEINVGHAYILGPGDVENAPSLAVGMLGCDYELTKASDLPPAYGGGAYKIAKIYEGAAFDSDARGPLSQPGVKVKAGDYILAVNGAPIDAREDPWAAFVGLADKTVVLTVASKPSITGTGDDAPRDIVLKTLGLGGEMNLRYRNWIETNRQTVAYKSDGKVGYIYVPNTGVDGQSDLFRQFFGQIDKKALIIDERWNGGGQIPSRFVELLNRPVTNYYARRDGNDWPWPPDAQQGPKCMLINGLAGSGGDCFPWLFKQNKIGKLIGMRTWGGLVGISGNPGFVDGGSMSVPTFGFYKKDGTWGIEGHGVDPDMVVVDDPAKMQNGGDPQLEAAINEMLSEIASGGYNPPKRPTPPDRSGMGLPEKDR